MSPAAGEAAVPWPTPVEAAARSEGMRCELPGEEPEHERLNLWAEGSNKAEKNQGVIINTLFATKKSNEV